LRALYAHAHAHSERSGCLLLCAVVLGQEKNETVVNVNVIRRRRDKGIDRAKAGVGGYGEELKRKPRVY
jgi:hypothetical protein